MAGGVVALGLKQAGEVVEALGSIGMVGVECLHTDGEGAFLKRCGDDLVAMGIEHFLTWSADGMTRLWDLAAGESLLTLDGVLAKWSRDGARPSAPSSLPTTRWLLAPGWRRYPVSLVAASG
jgi:hypothetical protein